MSHCLSPVLRSCSWFSFSTIFLLSSLNPSVALRSIVLRYACFPTAVRNWPTNVCVLCCCFCSFFCFFFRDIHFSEYYVPYHCRGVSLLNGYCCVCVCFLPIYSGRQVRWMYQPGLHRRKVTQDFSSTFLLRRMPLFFSREGSSRSFLSSTVRSKNVVY